MFVVCFFAMKKTEAKKGSPARLPKVVKPPYDPEKIAREIEQLKVTQGPLTGKNMTVLEWEHRVLDALATHRKVAQTLPRGNGKTAFASAIATCAITPGGSLFRPRGSVVIVASSMKQGRISFDHVLHFMKDIIYQDGEFVGSRKTSRDWRVSDNPQIMKLAHLPSGTTLEVAGSDSKRLHGQAPSLVLMDEPAKYVGTDNGASMYTALSTAMGKQANPRMLMIGTRPTGIGHWFHKQLYSPPENTFPIIYAVDEKDVEELGLFSDEIMERANPSWNELESLREEVRSQAADAKTSPQSLGDYRALCLNMGTHEGEDVEDVIDTGEWAMLCKNPVPPPEGPVAVGIDLGGGNSMTALSLYWPATGRLMAWGCYPENPDMEKRGVKDGCGNAYTEMVDQGTLLLRGVKTPDNGAFLRELLEEFADQNNHEWLGVAGDRYKISELKQCLYDVFVTEEGFLPFDTDELIEDRAVGGGSHGWSDLESFRKAVYDEHLRPGINLALDFAISQAICKRDTNGNAKLDKSHQKGRIDVLQAVIHAVGVGERWRNPVDAEVEVTAEHYVLDWT